MTLILDGSIKALKPCKHCGGRKANVLPVSGPHAKRLDCADCGRFHNWLSMKDAILFGFYEKAGDHA